MFELYSAEAYARQLKALLPRGVALNLQNDSFLSALLLAVGDELARVDSRRADLEREIDPRSTTELLSDWERVLALPDVCTPDGATVEQRRAAVVAKYTQLGGQSRQFFIDLADALGYTVTITEFRPFVAGSTAGSALYNDPAWRHTWQVNAPEETVFYFRAGAGSAGEPLRAWGNEQLECVINDRKPAHTRVLFAYGS
jgi:uncharacterized protein YmfQ (DUF2313 family)